MLTPRFVEAAKPADRRQEIACGLVGGLVLVVEPTGRKSYAIRFRVGGKQRKSSLGRHPDTTLADARRKAKELIAACHEGRDPGAEREDAKRGSILVAATIQEYIDNYQRPRNKAWKTVQRTLAGNLVPAWEGRGLQTITRRDIIKLLDETARRAPVTANLLKRFMSKFFRWAVSRDIIPANPMIGVEAPTKETSRDRVLTDNELARLWAAAGELGFPYGGVYQMLVLTGARLNEIAQGTWGEINLDEAVWVIPASRSKNKQPHRLPLSAQGVDVLRGLPRIVTPEVFVFPAGRRPVMGFDPVKKKLDAAMGISDWRSHDIRRSVASGMARLRVQPHLIERILNHSSGGAMTGLAKIYNRHDYGTEMRDALQLWGDHVAGLISGERLNNIIPLRA